MADLKTLMEDIARAIRLKTRVSDKINAQDFPQKIREIPQGESSSFFIETMPAEEIETIFEFNPNVDIKLLEETKNANDINE